MEAQTATRRDLGTALIEKCWKDPEFRKQVISDPKGSRVFASSSCTIPRLRPNLTELSDDDLERVAGGTELVVALIAGEAVVVGGVVSAASASAAITIKKGW